MPTVNPAVPPPTTMKSYSSESFAVEEVSRLLVDSKPGVKSDSMASIEATR